MKKIKLSGHLRRVDIQVSILMIFVAVFSSVCIFAISYRMTYRQMINSLKERVYSIHRYLENVLDKTTFTDINTKGDQKKTSYQNTKIMLENIRRSSGVRYLYTAKQNSQGDFIYIVDGLDSNAHDFRYPGDLIEHEIYGDMQRALSNEIVLPSKIKNTDWGEIFITYFPIHDGENVVGVLGIEFEAKQQYITYRNLSIMVPIIAVFCCIFSVVAALAIFKRISNPTFQDMYNTDQLTKLKNRNAYEIDIKNFNALRMKAGIGVVSADLNNLKKVNDNLGHGKGDLYIQRAAWAIRDSAENKEIIYRIGGDEYAVIFRNSTEEIIQGYIERVQKKFCEIKIDETIKPSISIGYALFDENIDSDITSVCRRADDRMYEQKKIFHHGELK